MHCAHGGADPRCGWTARTGGHGIRSWRQRWGCRNGRGFADGGDWGEEEAEAEATRERCGREVYAREMEEEGYGVCFVRKG